MRIYQYSWYNNGILAGLNADKDVVLLLIDTFRQKAKEAINADDFDGAKGYMESIELAQRWVAKLEELEEAGQEEAEEK